MKALSANFYYTCGNVIRSNIPVNVSLKAGELFRSHDISVVVGIKLHMFD